MKPKRILFISPKEDPFTLTYGGSQRTNLLLKACAACGNVDVICFRELSSGLSMGTNVHVVYGRSLKRIENEGFHCKKVRALWRRMRDLFSSWKVGERQEADIRKERVIDSIVSQKNYDWIVTRYMSQALTMGLAKYADRLVVDVDDNPVDVAKDRVKTAETRYRKLYWQFYALTMRRKLRAFVDHVAVTFFPNLHQAQEYNSCFLPNIPFYPVSIQETAPEKIHRGRLLFVGNMSYYPNYLGVDHFLTHVFPLLNKNKDWEMHICGKDLAEDYLKKWSGIEGVRVLGFVDNLAREYSESEIVVIPIYHGAGTCIKVLEAMQRHRLVISTPKGVRGYEGILSPQEDYLLAKDDSAFVSLLNESRDNVLLQAKMTEHAASIVDEHYSKSAFFDVVKSALL